MSARVDKVLAKNKSFSASNFLPAEGKHDKKGLYAYVYGNKENTIFLGRNFCKAAVSGKDGKAGTLSHEMSHYKSISATKDHAYGTHKCGALAANNPSKAINNADNFQYWLEGQ